METLEPSAITPLRFKLDEPLALKAAWLDASRYNLRIVLFVLTVALLTSAFFVLQGGLRSPESIILQVVLTVGGSGVLGVVVIILMRAVFLPMQVRKNLRQQKALSEEMQLFWTDDEFRYATGKSQTLMPFRDLHGFKASGHVILLYRTDFIYHLVPVAAFGNSDLLEAFMQRLSSAGVRRL